MGVVLNSHYLHCNTRNAINFKFEGGHTLHLTHDDVSSVACAYERQPPFLKINAHFKMIVNIIMMSIEYDK